MHVSLTIDGEPFDLGHMALVQLIELMDEIMIHQPLFSRLAQHLDPCVRAAVSGKRSLSAEAINSLISESNNPMIQENMALYHLLSPGITYEALVKWIEDDQQEWVIKLAAHIDQLKLSQGEIDGLISMLAKHHAPCIRRALAKNNRLPASCLKQLAQDDDESVAGRALRSLAIQHKRSVELDDDEDQLSSRPIELSGISNLMLSNYQELERLYSGAYNGSSSAGFHWEDGDRVSTGITDLDVMTGGMRRREITLIAGDNDSGITALDLNIVANSALLTDRIENGGNRVALFSLFHAEEDLSMRMLSTIAGVNLELMRQGQISSGDWRQLAEASGKLAESRLHFMHDPDISIYEIRTTCKRLLQKHRDVDLVVIDRLDLMNPYSDSDQREREFKEISGVLRMIADELDAPVLLTALLPSTPMLAIRNWSESLFDAVDTVLLLDRKNEVARLRMRKHIAYPASSITLKYDPNRMKFDSTSDD